MMTVAGILILLGLTLSGSTEKTCSDMDVLNHLNVTRRNELLSMIRPVRNYQTPTRVNLTLIIYTILDVMEVSQTFHPHIWLIMTWKNEFTSWNKSEFCDIEKVAIPNGILWKPDIKIQEMTGTETPPQTPYVMMYDDGWIQEQHHQAITSTCKMNLYKFPFDVQECSLTLKSVVHTNKELKLHHLLNSEESSEWTRELLHSQYEWLFMNMDVSNKTISTTGFHQDAIVFTIRMRRRSVLYAANFLLPILFFLCLDLSSFLIPDTDGGKIGFKITVLLAVTVMQLILNDIVPSSSNSVPLIAIYCIGMFIMMLLSLLETILVIYLIQKDSKAPESEKGKKWTHLCNCATSTYESPTELLKAGDSHHGGSQSLERHSGDMNELIQALTQIINSMNEAKEPGYWSRVAVTINRVFFIFYVSAIIVFLVYMTIEWQ